MEPPQQQQQQQQQNDQLDVGGNKSSSSSSNYLCRQSSSRWTPTSDQIRILKELYYNNGVRSPSAEQIQRISARLRQYGKIEGKNVFYWFQNHKARERQKKRFTCPPTNPPPISDHITLQMQMQRGGGLLVNGRSNWRSHEEHIYNNKSLSITPGVTSSSSTPGVLDVGHMGSYGYGSVTMEKSFRDCSISAVGSHNIWVGADHNPNPNPNLNPYSSSPHNLFDQNRKSVIFMEDHDQDDEEGDDQEEDQYEQQQQAVPPELETLPLFPLHGDNIISSAGGCFKPDSDSCYATTWHHYSSDSNMACSRSSTSLELSLNSYTGHS